MEDKGQRKPENRDATKYLEPTWVVPIPTTQEKSHSSGDAVRRLHLISLCPHGMRRIYPNYETVESELVFGEG